MRAALLALVLVLTPSCAPRAWNLRAFPKCGDGMPIKVLVDPTCPPDGVCGYSCMPDRWKATLCSAEARACLSQ